MPKRVGMTTKEHLISAPLPTQTDTYTVIAHEFVINKTREILDRKGFDIIHELYRCNDRADVAQGVYHLKFEGNPDPEMGMMFAWSNSYDKSMRFKCAVGGYLNSSKSIIISGQLGSWSRKHSGTADTEASDMIISQIENAESYYKQLVEDKAIMKTIIVSKRERAELTGRIYLENELLTGEQLGIVREQYRKPTFDYNSPNDSLWNMYNAMILALQKAHPKTWMDQQRMIHHFLTSHFDIKPGYIASIDPSGATLTEEQPLNQITIHQVIQEEETKTVLEENAHLVPIIEAEEIIHTQIENILHEELVIAHSNGLDTLPKEEPVIELVEPRTTEGHVAFSNESEETLTKVETITLEDNTWPCLGCGKDQPVDATWNDGQLCNKCVANEEA